MRQIPIDVDTAKLTEEVLSIPLQRIADGSGQARGEGVEAGWISGLSMTRLSLDQIRKYSALCHAMGFLCLAQSPIKWENDVRQIMVNKLDAGHALAPHRDGGPKQKELQRWHLPVVTNDTVRWWDEITGSYYMNPFVWHGPVPYMHTIHSMANYHPTQDRVHVIVDLEN